MESIGAELLHHSETLNGSFRRKLQGLLLFRLLLGIFFLMLTILVQSRHHADFLAERLQPLYLFSAALFIFTIFASLGLGKAEHLREFAYLQIVFDALAVTFLIYMSGGIDSILSFLYMIVIIYSATILLKRGSFWAASICSICYGTLLDLQYFGLINTMQILGSRSSNLDIRNYFYVVIMNIVAFFVVAYISGYLAEELDKSGIRIEKQEQNVRDLEILNQNIVESINSGLLTINLEGRIQYVNRHAEEILGFAREKMVDRRVEEVLPGLRDSAVGAWEGVTGEAAGAGIRRNEMDYERPSAEKLHLGYTVSALQDFSGRCIGWVINFQDLTAIKEMESHMQRMERLALAGKYAAEIAHEIKNPLAAVSGSMQMLRTEMPSDSALGRLSGIVCREIDRINALVTDFLWLARKPSRVEKLQALSVSATVLDTLSLMHEHQEISARYQVRTVFSGDPVICVDPHVFQQILWNLLRNALEAMPQGGGIVIRAGLDDSPAGSAPGQPRRVTVEVEDSGEGIPAELLDKVFEPFFTTKEKGTGLGLSTVYQLVQSSGGNIGVSSVPPHGTTFSVSFPAAATPLAATA